MITSDISLSYRVSYIIDWGLLSLIYLLCVILSAVHYIQGDGVYSENDGFRVDRLILYGSLDRTER